MVDYVQQEKTFERVQYLPVETQIVHYPEAELASSQIQVVPGAMQSTQVVTAAPTVVGGATYTTAAPIGASIVGKSFVGGSTTYGSGVPVGGSFSTGRPVGTSFTSAIPMPVGTSYTSPVFTNSLPSFGGNVVTTGAPMSIGGTTTFTTGAPMAVGGYSTGGATYSSIPVGSIGGTYATTGSIGSGTVLSGVPLISGGGYTTTNVGGTTVIS